MLQQHLPPQDIESEAACLASILISKDALFKVLEILNGDDFYLEQHRIIFEVVRELDRKNSPIDLITIKQRLVNKGHLEKIGGDAFLADLYRTVSTSANAEFYAKRIQELSLRRKLIAVSTKVVETCYDLGMDTAEMLDEAEKRIFEVTERRITSDMQSIEEIVRETLETINTLYEQKRSVTGIPSGFKDLDEMLTGFHPSELIIIAARPSMGKTALALNFLNHMVLKTKKPVIFFSLEMPAVHLLMRLICIESMVDAQRIRTGHFSVEEAKKIHNVAGKFSESPIYIDDAPGVTVSDIRAKCRRIAQRESDGLGAIIIDYLQLISSTSRADRQQQISEISRGLKLLARELECPVMALSQLSRAVESRADQRPQLSDLRESGAIEQDADVVMFIFREDRVKKDTERKGRADIIVAKQRNGPIGDIELLFWDKYTKFQSIDKVHTYEEAAPDRP
jgi:replicative DNA helicase